MFDETSHILLGEIENNVARSFDRALMFRAIAGVMTNLRPCRMPYQFDGPIHHVRKLQKAAGG
jgi:hypothetical protein